MAKFKGEPQTQCPHCGMIFGVGRVVECTSCENLKAELAELRHELKELQKGMWRIVREMDENSQCSDCVAELGAPLQAISEILDGEGEDEPFPDNLPSHLP